MYSVVWLPLFIIIIIIIIILFILKTKLYLIFNFYRFNILSQLQTKTGHSCRSRMTAISNTTYQDKARSYIQSC